jgi:hypothetical protein
MGSPKKAEELGEAALLRVEPRGGAEMPLADQPDGVAGCLEAVREGRFAQRQADVFSVHSSMASTSRFFNPDDVWTNSMRAYDPKTGLYKDQSIGDTPKIINETVES